MFSAKNAFASGKGAEFAALLSDYGEVPESHWTSSGGLLSVYGAFQAGHSPLRISGVLGPSVSQSSVKGSASERPDVSEVASLDGGDGGDLSWPRSGHALC